MKNVIWIGDSRKQVRSFPKTVKKKVGDALISAQSGDKHPRAKPLRALGSGVWEIVALYDTNTYRAVYAVNIGENIYVLHAFQKKSSHGIRTPKHVINLIKQRLKEAKNMESKNE